MAFKEESTNEETLRSRRYRDQIREKGPLFAWATFKSWNLRKSYGISMEHYFDLLRKQNFSCAICRKKHNPSIKGQELHIDHNHKTGMVRGLLCINCNYALGNLREDEILFASALQYLRRHRDDV